MSPDQLLEIADRAIASLDPADLVADALVRDHRPAYVAALGKAAPSLIEGARHVLGDSIAGVVCAGLDGGGHPIPNRGSVEAAHALLSLAERAGRGDRFIALVSGGGSSVAALPAPGLSLADKQLANRDLIRGGASIEEINLVRKHISAIKAGRLGIAAQPAAVETYVLSDIVSGLHEWVASGPTVSDKTRASDALDVATRFGLSAPILEHLRCSPDADRVVAGRCTILADNQRLVTTAESLARAKGGPTGRVLALREPLVGDPGLAAEELADRLSRCEAETLVIVGSECTPVISRDAGKGGRAHHLALLLCEPLASAPGSAAVVIGSDGVDGPSGGRGAQVSSESLARLHRAGVDVAGAIERFDSQTALASIGSSLAARPSGTNLADLVLVWTGARL